MLRRTSKRMNRAPVPTLARMSLLTSCSPLSGRSWIGGLHWTMVANVTIAHAIELREVSWAGCEE
jgi:hypothetical protein